MSSDKIAIKVEGVYKDFKLPHLRKNTIKSLFTSLFEGKRTKSFEAQHALEDINFEIEKGEFFGIVGRNGSGKSTLLKILATIYQPTKGRVTINGKLVPFIELGVGFNPELTGRENVYLNGALLGFSTEEIDVLYDEIVEFAELEKFMDQKLKNYSSGMQVRLAFSMATRAKTDILLVDEVLAVGDADFQRKCFNYFKSLKKENVTVVFVTHDMGAVREYCDRAMLIDNSKVVSIGKTDKITKQYIQLFQETESRGKDSSKQKRWGNKKVQYISVEPIPKKITDKDSTVRIKCVAKANEKVEGIIFGFMVKNASGEAVLGINSQIKKHPPMSLQANEVVTLEWDMPNVFNDGVHWVEPAIVHNGGIDVCDWWEEAASFTVRREEVTPYIVNPTVNLNLERD